MPETIHALPVSTRIIAAAGAFFLTIAHPETITPDPHRGGSESAQYSATCNEVSPQAVQAVSALLAAPGNPIFNPGHTPKDPAEADRKLQDTVAARLGIHVVRDALSISRLKLDLQTKPAAYPFNNYLAAANAYARKFGITIQAGDIADQKKFGGFTVPAASDLETRTAKNDLANAIVALYGTPVEFTAASGLRRILLVSHLQKAAAEAITGGNHDTIIVDIDDTVGSQVYKHETAHLLDAAECGGPEQAANDPQFSELTGPGDPYGGAHLMSYKNDWFDRVSRAERHLPEENLTARQYCQSIAIQNTAAAAVKTYSNYHPNVVEDKAETEKNITNSEYAVLTNPRFKTLYEKFRLSLTRLYMLNPRLTEYFIRTNPSAEYAVPADAPSCPRR